MTWIVGASSAIGFAFGISDIRVTFKNGRVKDCLQKLYPMAPFIAAGFAGSVRIGFTILQGLADLFPKNIPPAHSFVPQSVTDTLSSLAKDIFKESSPEEAALRSDLMLLGAHPTLTVGIPGYMRCSVHILRSPEFVPQEAQMGQVVSIGTGSVYQPYKDVLNSWSSDPMALLRMAPAGLDAGSMVFSMVIQKTIEKNPLPGVSPHAHICVLRGGEVKVFPNDETVYPPNGEPFEFKMPRVATNWEEFDRMVSADGSSSACVVC
jgi:hypothetical protein